MSSTQEKSVISAGKTNATTAVTRRVSAFTRFFILQCLQTVSRFSLTLQNFFGVVSQVVERLSLVFNTWEMSVIGETLVSRLSSVIEM